MSPDVVAQIVAQAERKMKAGDSSPLHTPMLSTSTPVQAKVCTMVFYLLGDFLCTKILGELAYLFKKIVLTICFLQLG